MNIRGSSRLARLGSAIFAEVAVWKKEVEATGVKVIDLGIGSPDRPPSAKVIQALEQGIHQAGLYGYPSSEGSEAFRSAVAQWYLYRFGVELEQDREVLALMGSQDGLAHLALALTDPRDVVLLPDPGYPIYTAAVELAGAVPYYMPLLEANDYLPDLLNIPREVTDRAKYMVLNYPSNPLAVVAGREFFEHAVSFAKERGILLVHDLAYSEMAFDGYKPMSVLEIPGAKEAVIEFHSLSKSFQMAGCRLAFVVGNANAVGALRALKANIDYGSFEVIQRAGVAALEEDMLSGHTAAGIYEGRRELFVHAMNELGWRMNKPQATMFVWAPVPTGWTSRQFSREMVFQAGVVVIPGDAFGAHGEGYVRMALVHELDVLEEATGRIARFWEEFVQISD
jgi:LL-diaminopimelate aminotransferase